MSDISYKIGEEIIYKNSDHVEPGIIESIRTNKDTQSPIIDIKFKGGRRVEASIDTVMSRDETDLSNIPYTSNDFIENAKCLTHDELQHLQNPLPLTPL